MFRSSRLVGRPRLESSGRPGRDTRPSGRRLGIVAGVEALEARQLLAFSVLSASAATPVLLQPTVDAFRADLGTLNPNTAGSLGQGRREINWDGVPDALAAPQNLPANFFNVNSPRGVVLSTPGTGFQVSADTTPAPPGTAVRFGHIDPNYAAEFQTFSTQRLFTALGSNVTDVNFFVPGSTTPAATTGFGAVFTDVDVATSTTIELFDATNASLGVFNVPTSTNGGLSFLGISEDTGAPRIARVRITSGNAALGAPEAANDLVVMDDFLYGEPQTAPVFNFASAISTGTEGALATLLTVNRSGGLTQAATVVLNVTGGTATTPADFSAATVVNFAPGQATAGAAVNVLNDGLTEDVETASFALASPSVGSIGTQATTTLVIRDLQLPSANAVALVGGTTLVTFNTATPGSALAPTAITGLQVAETILGIDFRPADGQLYGLGSTGRVYTIDRATGAATQKSALAADPADTTLPFAALSGTSFGVDFNPVPDRLRVTSNTGQNLRINVDTGLVTTDAALNPGAPDVVASAYTNSFFGATSTTLYAIDAATNSLLIQTPPNNGTLTTALPLNVGDVTESAGFDIRAANNSAFAALTVGGTAGLYSLNLTTGAATLVGPIGTGALAVGGLALVPNGTLNFSAPVFSVVEGQPVATITVNRVGGSDGAVSASYATSAGTATNGQDYTDVSGTVNFADGSTTPQTFTIPIFDDANFELFPNETVNLTLTSPIGGAVLGAQAAAQLQIIDNEPRSLSINDVIVNEAAGTATFTVSLNTGSGLPVTVTARTTDGTATAGQDFTAVGPIVLTFAPGVTTQSFTVPILDDAVFKSNQTFTVTLSSPTNAVLAEPQGTGTIIDNDAPVVVQGRTFTAGENTPFTGVVASFSDPNGISPLASYSAIVNFGDGSPLATGTIIPIGNYFIVNATHTYAREGVYGVSTRVLSGAITSNVGFGQAVVADGALTVQVAALTPVAGTAFTANVASFQDAGGLEAASSYFATIDYGDGTPIAPGQVIAQTVATGAPASTSNLVVGRHTFVAAGSYNVGVTVRSQGGSVITSYQVVTVTNPPPIAGFLSGFLNPSSDSGTSNSDAITNVNQPNFEGFANPGASVRYFAQAPGGTPLQIGQGAADASGFYSITSFNPLPDGSYTILAAFSNLPGVTATQIQVLPVTGKVGPLVIDTVAPKVTGLSFNRLTGRAQIAFQDDRSGLNRSTLLDGANYRLSSRRGPSTSTRVTGIAVPTFPSNGSTVVQAVTLTVNRGRKLTFGVFTLLARSGGIGDVAGNALDGEFYGTFPSGNGRPGGDFSADFASFHNITRAPGSANGSVSPTAAPVTPATTRAAKIAKATAVSHHKATTPIASRQVMFGKPAKP